jgi:hypothetical protein
MLSSSGRCSRRSVHLADRFGSEFAKYAAQGADAGRQRITVALDDVVKLLGKRGGFVVG